MNSEFSIAFHFDKVYLRGEFVPAGTLACMALNLPKETISELEGLYRQEKRDGDSRVLRERLYAIDCVSGAAELLPESCLDVIDQLICFRAYIRHFLQRYDAAKDAPGAWESFLEKLDELVAQARNMENYARTVLQPNLYGLTVTYETHASKLCERFILPYGSLLLLDLLRSLQSGHSPRLCPCCGKWFIPTRTDEVYCSGAAPGGTGRTCREVGASRMFSQRADASLPVGMCRSACSRIYTRKNRGQLTAQQAEELTAECRRLRDLALGGQLSNDELEKRLGEVAGRGRSGKKPQAE